MALGVGKHRHKTELSLCHRQTLAEALAPMMNGRAIIRIDMSELGREYMERRHNQQRLFAPDLQFFFPTCRLL